MVIWSSTQNPSHTQDLVAKVLGIPFNRVVVKVSLARTFPW
jgi:xanthine dehydrogenase molybdopterin-binding subunit B